MANIAFIGLGQMGSPMATNLLQKGHQLNVYDINPSAVSKLQALGATPAKSPADAVKNCEFIITMLPNGKLVENVIFGDNGIVESIESNALVIDMSTIHPLESDGIRARLQTKGIEFMDVPVGRTSDNAISGTLLILAGGTQEQIDRTSAILLCMGSEIINTGGPG